MFSVIGAAHSRAKEIKEALDDQSPPIKMYGVYHASLIDSLVDLMTKLPVSELGSDQAINAFIIFSGQFAFLRKALEEYMAGPYADPEVMEELEKLKVQGYGNREHDQVVDSKRAVLKTNVEVHLARIDIEFTHLSAALQKNA